MAQAVPSPSDGWHACSRRCQLALDLTVGGTGYPHPPLHSPGDCNVVGVVSFCFRICCFTWKHISSNFATFHLILADRRATARTTIRWAMQHPDQKKKFFFSWYRARSRLERSLKRLVVGQLFSSCKRTDEMQEVRCLPNAETKHLRQT